MQHHSRRDALGGRQRPVELPFSWPLRQTLTHSVGQCGKFPTLELAEWRPYIMALVCMPQPPGRQTGGRADGSANKWGRATCGGGGGWKARTWPESRPEPHQRRQKDASIYLVAPAKAAEAAGAAVLRAAAQCMQIIWPPSSPAPGCTFAAAAAMTKTHLPSRAATTSSSRRANEQRRDKAPCRFVIRLGLAYGRVRIRKRNRRRRAAPPSAR